MIEIRSDGCRGFQSFDIAVDLKGSFEPDSNG